MSKNSLWEVAENCGLCGATAYKEHFRVASKRYVECGKCKVTRLYDRVLPSKLDLLYCDYYDAGQFAISQQELEKQLANPTFSFRRKRLESFVPARKRAMFEIGCGDGNFLGHLKPHGWRVAGCEYGPRTVELVKARHGIEVEAGDFASLNTPPHSLDVIGSYAVLEHLYDPMSLIRAVKHALKPGGILHLQLPNFSCLERRVFGDCWSLLCFPQHVYLYGRSELGKILEGNGFQILSIKTYDPWHSPGTTSSSIRNLIRRALTGRSPWSDRLAPAMPNENTNAEHATTGSSKITSRVVDAVVNPAAKALARAQGVFGVGNMIDLIARNG